MAREYKTPEYQRRQVKKFNESHDRLTVFLKLGELEKYRAAGIDNPLIIKLIEQEYERRLAIDAKYTPAEEVKLPEPETRNPMPKPVEPEQETIPFFD